MISISKLTSFVLLLTVSLTSPLRTLCQDSDKLTVPSGTRFKTRLETPISSKLSEVGDTIIVTLLEPMAIDAQHVLPRGTEMTGKVTFVKRAGKVKGRAEVYALINELTTNYGSEPIQVSIDAADDASNDEKIRPDEEGKLKSNNGLGDDLEDATRGAALGSLASTPVAIATGSVGAAIAGPAVGAIAGLLLSRGKEVRLPVGSVFRMKFDKDLILPVSTAQARPASRVQK